MRQFLAVTPGTEVLEALARLVDDLRPSAGGWRWVRPEGMHLTLRFLGEVSPEVDAGARELWRAAARSARPCRLMPSGIDAFPSRRRPRVLVMALDEVGLLDSANSDRSRAAPERALGALAAELERSARRLGFDPEERPFRPHVTLARAGRGRPPACPERVALKVPSFAVDRLLLMRSELSPAGARYTVLESYPLGGGAPTAGTGENG